MAVRSNLSIEAKAQHGTHITDMDKLASIAAFDMGKSL